MRKQPRESLDRQWTVLPATMGLTDFRDSGAMAGRLRAGMPAAGPKGTTNEDSAFGPARHPVDPSRSPGGSSGGSAVSVAAGMSLATLGTDTGGSIRIPAAACGLVGLKPGYGELSVGGVVPLSTTLDHVGPLARTVTDAAYVYGAMGGSLPNGGLRAASPRDLRVAVS